MTGLRVMVVDDSLITINKLTKMLTELGYEVVSQCRSGAVAVASYPKVKPDIVTMDITMPDMDGIEATKAIMASYPQANIIMVTSHGQEQMVLEAIDAGARGYVLKPVKEVRLQEVIQKVLKNDSDDEE
ncbi:response regulator [Zooshikella ganghwensis]|uniref:Response regulator n=1 Tax=Zooshikella ganghwensis TaxID=202772 RepID=A0A4P9VKY5_9GAMM|nr:response regulator [Zooshikella ganghwensis]RDH43923.1 response regulator [Zooshikella ganghwensis]